MSTTIDALRNLGLKVNGEEPQSNYVNNVINEIADNYSPSEAGMSNPMTTAGDIIVGGTSGAPTRLAKGTQGQVLSVGSSGLEWANASGGGGTQLYKHTFSGIVRVENEDMPITFDIISTASSAVTNATTANNMLNGFITGMAAVYTDRMTVVGVQPYADMEEDLAFHYALCAPAGDGLVSGLLYQKSFATVTDTVTAL